MNQQRVAALQLAVAPFLMLTPPFFLPKNHLVKITHYCYSFDVY